MGRNCVAHLALIHRLYFRLRIAHTVHFIRKPKHSNRIMSSAATSAAPPATAPTTNAAGKRICCVCKDTKKVRDECIFQFGEEKCQEPIELHKVCLRSEGFDIQ